MSEVVHINAAYPWHCGEFAKVPYGGFMESTTNESHVTCPACLALKQTAEYGTYKPSFPRTKFADENDLSEQYTHIRSEVAEIGLAMTIEEVAEETMDLYQSTETKLAILAEKHGVDLSAIKRQVIEKNQARGYYK